MPRPREWVAPVFLAPEIILSLPLRAWLGPVHLAPGRGQHLAILVNASQVNARRSSNEPVHPVVPAVPVLVALAAPVAVAPEDPVVPVVAPVADAPVRVVVGADPVGEPRVPSVAVGAKTSLASRSGPSAKSLKCAKPRVWVE